MISEQKNLAPNPPKADSGLIKIEQLTKVFKSKSLFRSKSRTAVDGLNLEIFENELFGFLGPNGAGKTTTIKLILGFIFPTAGNIRLFQQAPGSNAAKFRVGFLPEVAYYYRYLKAYELLDAYAQLFRLSKKERTRKIESLFALVGLTESADISLRDFSKGMLQRFGFAQALINDPDLLILDEPTSGLDPIARKEIRDIIVHLHQLGKTIFFSSHELSQVEMICTRVGILHQGRLVQEGKLTDLLAPSRKIRIEIGNAQPELAIKLRSLPVKIEFDGNDAQIRLDDKSFLFPLLNKLEAEQVELYSVNTERESLEDLFIKTVQSPKK